MITARKIARLVVRTIVRTTLGRRALHAVRTSQLFRDLRFTAEERALQRRLELDASFTRGIGTGESLAEALVRYARSASIDRLRVETRGVFQRLIDDPATDAVGSLAFATFLWRDQLFESSLGWFRRAGIDLAVRHAAPEYFDSLIATHRDRAADLVRHLAEHRAELSAAERVALMRILAKHRLLEDLRIEVDELLVDPARDHLSDADATELTWFAARLAETDEPAREVRDAIPFAVMDYKLLDRQRSSSNRGDYVQTLAALSHLVRFEGVEFVGDTELASCLDGLKGHVAPDRRIVDLDAKVLPVPLDRDFASGRSYPEGTWLICNGWFMHRAFKGRVDFPFPESVNPIMISFHVQDPSVLSPEVADELRPYQPIGCRDWTTVYRLRDHGITAFFSGCVTTTVGQVLEPAAPSGQRRMADVEAGLSSAERRGWTVDDFIQVGPQVTDFTLVEGIEDARTMMNEYRPYDRIATSRLHCYLPARSMGLDVDFRPRNRADVRFEGLLDLDADRFAAIRSGIETKLEIILRAILSGSSRDDVYALWRDITADDVAAADRHCVSYPARIPSSIDVPATVDRLRSSVVVQEPAADDSVVDGEVVEVAFALDQNLEEIFPVVLQSLVEHTARPVRCHVLARGLGRSYLDRLHGLFPQLAFDYYDFGDVDYGADIALLSHISVSTMDRLFLAELLPQVAKVLYLDIDILVQDDVGRLFDIELGDHVFAGKRTRLHSWASLVRPITRASLHMDAERAWVMRRRLHGTSDLTTATFNAGVVLMNLAEMRRERFTAEHLHLVEQCRLNDQDIFNVYARNRVVELDPRWNSIPSQDCEPDPSIIHWAGPAKPWKDDHVLFVDRFRAASERVRAKTVRTLER